jgi:hypothetical protein
MGKFTGYEKTGFNTTGNMPSSISNYSSGRNIYSVGLGRTRNTVGSISRKFNYCNSTSRNLNVAFACTFDIPRFTDIKETLSDNVDPNNVTTEATNSDIAPKPPLTIGGLQSNNCPNLPKDTPYQICSSWPYFGGTYNTNSRYSTLIGSQTGNIQQIFSTENNHVTISSSSVAADNTIYNCFNVMSLDTGNLIAIQGYIKAFDSKGNEKWKFLLNENDTFIRSSPTIGPNKIIYFGSTMGYIYALNPDGTLNWKKQYFENIIEENKSIPLSIYGSLAIGNDGNIYFGGSAKYKYLNESHGIAVLLSVNINNGSINFKYKPKIENRKFIPYIKKNIAIDKFNNIYYCYEYTNTPPNKIKSILISLNNKGILRWDYPLLYGSTILSYPILNKDNSLVFITSYNFNSSTDNDNNKSYITCYISGIDCLRGTKNILNSLFLKINALSNNLNDEEGSLSMDSNDNLYLLIRNEIYKFKYQKKIGYFKANSFNDNNLMTENCMIYPSTNPLIGKDGTVYFVATLLDENNNINYNSYMIAITSECKLKWIKKIPRNDKSENIEIITSPAILGNGDILIQITSTNSDYKDKMNSRFYKFD